MLWVKWGRQCRWEVTRGLDCGLILCTIKIFSLAFTVLGLMYEAGSREVFEYRRSFIASTHGDTECGVSLKVNMNLLCSGGQPHTFTLLPGPCRSWLCDPNEDICLFMFRVYLAGSSFYSRTYCGRAYQRSSCSSAPSDFWALVLSIRPCYHPTVSFDDVG